MVHIAVTGRAERKLPAERGTLSVEVVVTGEDRREVLARVTAAHAELVVEAAAHAASGAATWWGAQDVSAGVIWEWTPTPRGESERVRRFQAQCGVQVRFADFAALGTWAVAVAEREDHQVGSIRWDLTDSRRDDVIDEVRTEATRDALAKAAVYATAAGLGAPRLVALYEDGLRPGGSDGPRPVAMARMMAADSGGGAGITLRPADIELAVSLSVDVEADA